MKIIFKDIFDPTKFTGSLFYAVIFFAIAFLLSAIIRRFTKRILAREFRHPNDKTMILFYSRLLQGIDYVVLLIVYFHLIPALQSVGTALLTSASVLSVIVGLAAQKTLGNIFAGMALLVYRPFSVGDVIQVSAPTGVETGVVQTIDLAYTILLSSDNRKVIVPNNILYDSVTINIKKN
jgi:small-conductance mechanosensitive channel